MWTFLVSCGGKIDIRRPFNKWMTIDKSMINGIYSQAITWFNQLKLTFATRVVFKVIDLIGIVGKFSCTLIKPWLVAA